MESAEIPFPEAPKYNLSIVTAGENAVLKAIEISSDLRSEGYSVSIDTVGRSIKAQMKYSNKIGAEYTVVLGDNELEENKAKLKNMSDGAETEIALDNFSEEFFGAVVKDSMNGIADASFSGMNPEDINNLFKL
jgi:histidyl-tRNA synthetase